MSHYDVDCKECGELCFSAATGIFYECACDRSDKVKKKRVPTKADDTTTIKADYVVNGA